MALFFWAVEYTIDVFTQIKEAYLEWANNPTSYDGKLLKEFRSK